MVNIPVIGKAAEYPFWQKNVLSIIFPFLQKPFPREISCVHVKGESMIGVGIFPGDKLIVEQRFTAENGKL